MPAARGRWVMVDETSDKHDAEADEAAEWRALAGEISAQYPPVRLGTELVLLEINPHKAHAYWNIDVEDYRAAQARTGLDRAPLVIRLQDVTGDAQESSAPFDIEIQGMQGHWYIDLWRDGRTHVAELGFRRPDGGLERLARSNPVLTPPAAESPDYHTLAFDTAERRVTDLITDPDLNPQNTDVETGAPIPQAQPADVVPETTSFIPSTPLPALVFPMVEAEPPASLQGDVKAYFDRAAEHAAEATVVQPWEGHAAAEPRPRMPEQAAATSVERWPTAAELEHFVPLSQPAPEEEHAQDGARDQGPGSEPVTEPASEPGRGEEAAGGGQPEARSPDQPVPAPLEQMVGLSSMESGRREVALEVNVELHIFGRAKPGTELTLYGQPVPLRPDGTFSVRRPLPQGAVVLPLVAVDPPPAGPKD